MTAVKHDLLTHSPCHGLELSSPKFTLNEVKYVEVIVQGALDLACSQSIKLYNACFSSRYQRNFVVLHTARDELNFIHRSFSWVSCSHAGERSRRFISSHIFLVQASRCSRNSIGLTSDQFLLLLVLFLLGIKEENYTFYLVLCQRSEVSGVPPKQLKQNLRSWGRSLKSQ